METTLFEVKFFDGRKFRVFCRGRNQIKRFICFTSIIRKEIESIIELSNGIHTITEFEKIATNKL